MHMNIFSYTAYYILTLHVTVCVWVYLCAHIYIYIHIYTYKKNITVLTTPWAEVSAVGS